MLNAPMLFDYTDAKIIVVLDNLEDSRVAELWTNFTQAERDGRESDRVAALRGLERLDTGESKWLRELGEQAAKQGRLDRITVCTLSYPDITRYVPLRWASGGAIELG